MRCSHCRKKLPATMQSKGGKARAKSLTPAERSEIARAAVNARWAKAAAEKAEKE